MSRNYVSNGADIRKLTAVFQPLRFNRCPQEDVLRCRFDRSPRDIQAVAILRPDRSQDVQSSF